MSQSEAALVRGELERVLASNSFSRARNQAQFLRYLCERAAADSQPPGEADIAREAFGRTQTFDRKDDSIVRVEAHRLRKRLRSYYESEAAGSAVRIDLPPGQYAPAFIFEAPDNGTATPPSLTPQVSVTPSPLPTPALRFPASGTYPRWGAVALVAASVLLLGLAALAIRESVAASTTRAAAASRPSADITLSAVEQPGIRIIAGASSDSTYTDADGNRWKGDQFFAGGSRASRGRSSVLRTRDPILFQTRREGEFRYEIPLEPGLYELHLYFAETEFGPGNEGGGGETARVFNVHVNGKTTMWAYDVLADAGGANVANIRVIKDVGPGPGGKLIIGFEPLKESAFVNAIAVVPGLRARMRPIRLLAGTSAFRDPRGVTWIPERHELGGQLIVRPDLPAGSALYTQIHKAERFGNFNYAIPAAEGRYGVTLHFSERWFGPGKPGGGGEGSRVFDVVSNGVCLLKNFDIYKEAGGADRAVSRTFHGLTPNAQGKIQLSFVPVRHYAAVNAMEIVAEP